MQVSHYGANDIESPSTHLQTVSGFLPAILLEIPSLHPPREEDSSAKIKQRRFRKITDPNYEKPQDLLQAIMDLSTPGQKESDPEDLAYCQLVVSLAAVHTTGSALAQVIFDLTARPEYFDILREEVNQIVAEDGEGWGKQSLNKLRRWIAFSKNRNDSIPRVYVCLIFY